MNLTHWEITLNLMISDEEKFIEKQWIAKKQVIFENKKKLDKFKLTCLSDHVR